MSASCTLCPRACGIARDTARGYCSAMRLPHVARAMLHAWEEPCISGKNGAGAIFFCGCNLDCIFCQNHAISHHMHGETYDAQKLCALMLRLESEGASCIDLVTPAPHVPVLAPALVQAREKGLSIPVVYNTNAYETVDALRMLDGLVDVYLPDFKYVRAEVSLAYSGAADYFAYAAPALEEMHRQVGDLVLDGAGIARRGLLIRHLVLPAAVGETRRALSHIASRFSPECTHISLMGQYVPAHRAIGHKSLGRRLLASEYARAVEYCLSLGFTHVYVQSLDAADASYTPDFIQEEKGAGNGLFHTGGRI